LRGGVEQLRNASRAESEEPEPLRGPCRSSDPMIEAGGPSTEVSELAARHCVRPTGIIMLAPHTLLGNASMA